MKILAACNDTALFEQIKTAFDDMGVAFDRVSKGEDAIKEDDYDIYILSQDLPDMKAEDVCKNLSEDSIKIFIGAMGHGQRRDAFSAGADAYIVTPFSITEFFTVFKRQIDLISNKKELNSLKTAYEKMLKEQAELTEHMMLYNEQLQAEINRRAEELSAQKKKAFEISQRSITLEEALKDKETLLKEVHHRVKNNMQIISSLIALQMNTLDDKRMIDILKDTINRVRAMALVHEKLYQSSDISLLKVKDYFTDLITDIMQSYELRSYKTVNTKINVSVDMLGIDLMIPCGLIVSEIITNSIKYAFEDITDGEVYLSFRKLDNDKFELVIGDNGKGLPPDEELKKSRSLGWQLINDLVKRKLRGTLQIEREKGTRFKIIF
ncbi:MAG TPA: hypothetical protein HPP56_09625 [Nitrospirae bacterium]|nr:hypothetical protein [Nitrospirota bacterium]